MKDIIKKINFFQKHDELIKKHDELIKKHDELIKKHDELIKNKNLFQKIKASIKKYDPSIMLFLTVEKIDLKFIFDHIKNYAIASSMLVLAFYINKHREPILDGVSFSLDGFWAVVLILLGFILNTLNFVQIILVLAKSKLNVVPYVLISLLLFILTSKLFIASFLKQITG